MTFATQENTDLGFLAPELYAFGEAQFGSIWGKEEENRMLAVSRRLASNVKYERVEQEGFEHDLAQFLAHEASGDLEVVSVNSCGVALDLVWDYLNLRPGDEVVASGPNFFGAHAGVLRRGAAVIFADVAPQSLNMAPGPAADAVSADTRAILVTHMNGVRADVGAIRDSVYKKCDENGWRQPAVVEDCARSLGACPPEGDDVIQAYSFHRKKMISTLGEGGALVTGDRQLAAHARSLRSYGLGSALGSSMRMTEVQAAVGRAQLQRFGCLRQRRRSLLGARLQHGVFHVNEIVTFRGEDDVPYMHTLLLQGQLCERRTELREALASAGIGTSLCGRPTYLSHEVVAKRVARGELPNDALVERGLLCLPLHPAMSDRDEARFVAVFTGAISALSS